MEVKFNFQADSKNTLKDELLSININKAKKIIIDVGYLKETGVEIIEEFLADSKASTYISIGVDRKNTNRKMLETLGNYTSNLYVWDNNGQIEKNSGIIAIETDKQGIIYNIPGIISDTALTTDFCIYSKIVYNLNIAEDKQEFKSIMDILVKYAKSTPALKITEETINHLIDSKIIFSSKAYTRDVMSIQEMLNEKNKAKNVSEMVIPKIDVAKIEDIDLDIDIGDAIEKETTASENLEAKEDATEDTEDYIEDEEDYVEDADEVLDMESMLFEKADVKLDTNIKNKKNIDDVKNEEGDILKSRKIDLNKVTNLFIELSARSENGKNTNELRIPNYICDLLENFFEEVKTTKAVDNKRTFKISLDIVDVNTGARYIDQNASIIEWVGRTYTSYVSEKLSSVQYMDGDIARIIKLSGDMYHIEIIPTTSNEYMIWKKMCTNEMRSGNKCFGMM